VARRLFSLALATGKLELIFQELAKVLKEEGKAANAKAAGEELQYG
jgi:hypothetical protein